MKLGTACAECRLGKRKCIPPAAFSVPCHQCLKRNLKCSFMLRNAHKGRNTTLLPASLQDVEDNRLPSQAIIEELIELYLRHLHNKPQTLFHEPTLRKDAREGTLPPHQLLAILGLSARFSSDPQIRAQCDVYAAKAKSSLKQQIDHISLQNIQTCIMVGSICSGNGDVGIESIFYGIANTMAQLLKLSEEEDGTSDAITCEIKRRVWWTLYMIDAWSTVGIDLPRRLVFRGSGPQLPMDDDMFNSLQVGDPAPSKDSWKSGLWAYMLILVKIFNRIQDVNRRLAFPSNEDEDLIRTDSERLAADLEEFQKALPDDIKYSVANLSVHVAKGSGRTFVALHLGYHHYSTLLYYHYLDNRHPSTPTSRQYRDRCKHHAAAFSDIVRISLTNSEAEAVYNIVGHMTVVSSSVLVYTLLFGESNELPNARERLEINFQLLVRLRGLWPSVEPMINRLIIFQNSCIESAGLQSHRIDKWMVRFLLQHALVLDNRQSNITFGSTMPVSNPVGNRDLLMRSRITEEIIREAQVASSNSDEFCFTS